MVDNLKYMTIPATFKRKSYNYITLSCFMKLEEVVFFESDCSISPSSSTPTMVFCDTPGVEVPEYSQEHLQAHSNDPVRDSEGAYLHLRWRFEARRRGIADFKLPKFEYLPKAEFHERFGA